jgi:hypothetical protein
MIILLMTADGCHAAALLKLSAWAANGRRRRAAAIPGIRILATSRGALHANGELVRVLLAAAKLPPPTGLTALAALSYLAVELLVERASAAQNGCCFSDREAPMVAEICRRLDGVPRAIELVAAGQPISLRSKKGADRERLAVSVPPALRASAPRRDNPTGSSAINARQDVPAVASRSMSGFCHLMDTTCTVVLVTLLIYVGETKSALCDLCPAPLLEGALTVADKTTLQLKASTDRGDATLTGLLGVISGQRQRFSGHCVNESVTGEISGQFSAQP